MLKNKTYTDSETIEMLHRFAKKLHISRSAALRFLISTKLCEISKREKSFRGYKGGSKMNRQQMFEEG